jgi:hypothetical protein
MAHQIPGYMQNKAVVLAAGFCTNPLIFVAFFDKKYFTQPGGQAHLWYPPEIAIKKNAIWNPTTEGFATLSARISIIWENFEQNFHHLAATWVWVRALRPRKRKRKTEDGRWKLHGSPQQPTPRRGRGWR